jgi:hypothetical protein
VNKLTRIAKKAFNASKACLDTAKHLATTGEILVSQEEYEDRVNICKECPYYEKFASDECGDCLCFVKAAKAWLASQHCPQYKWEGDDLKIIEEDEDHNE